MIQDIIQDMMQDMIKGMIQKLFVIISNYFNDIDNY